MTWSMHQWMGTQPNQSFIAYVVTIVLSCTGKTLKCTRRYAAGLQLSAESGVVS